MELESVHILQIFVHMYPSLVHLVLLNMIRGQSSFRALSYIDNSLPNKLHRTLDYFFKPFFFSLVNMYFIR